MLNNIITYIITNCIDFYIRFISLSFFKFSLFLIYNKFILLFLFITYIFIIFDSRFRLKNKIFILILFILLIILLKMYDYMDLNLFIKELYWYGLALNTSFIIHACWLHWIYSFFWKRRKETICWIISRIAFICSLSFLVILINSIYILIHDNFGESKRPFFEKHEYIFYLFILFCNFIYTIVIILRFFMGIFASYSGIIMGIKKITSFDRKGFIIFIFYFIFSCIMSYWVLGISRIMFNWLFIFMFKFIEMFINYYKHFKDIHPDIMNKFSVILLFFIITDFRNMISDLELNQYKSWDVYDWQNLNTSILIYKGNYIHPQNYYLFILDNLKNYQYISFVWEECLLNNKIWIRLAKNKTENFYYLEDINDTIKFYELLKKLELSFNLTKEEIEELEFEYKQKKDGLVNLKVY